MKKSFDLFVMAVLLLTSGCLFSQDHEYVDLGLPSGTLWATCNVGANAAEEYGDYFAWGETTTKAIYDWNTCKYCESGNRKQLTKYCNRTDFGYNGFSDHLTTLQPTDDAATANWGDDWYTPTHEQWLELYRNTTQDWTTQNGVNGRLFTAENGNSLFLPAAGGRSGDKLFSAGDHGYYWSSTLDTDGPDYAWDFYFDSVYYFVDHAGGRLDGRSVRAVRSSRHE